MASICFALLWLASKNLGFSSSCLVLIERTSWRYICVAVGADVDRITSARATRYVTPMSLFPLLSMLST